MRRGEEGDCAHLAPQVETIYWRLKDHEVKENGTTRRLRVFWDKECLQAGEEWEQGFCSALCSSSIFIPIMSRDTFAKGPWASIPPTQEEDVPPAMSDSVFLEFELALVLVIIKHVWESCGSRQIARGAMDSTL